MRSVITAQHAPPVIVARMAPAIGVPMGIDRGPRNAGAVIVVVARIAITDQRALMIGRIWREAARTGVGRALIDVVVLRVRLGQPLVSVTVAIAAAAAGIRRLIGIGC